MLSGTREPVLRYFQFITGLYAHTTNYFCTDRPIYNQYRNMWSIRKKNKRLSTSYLDYSTFYLNLFLLNIEKNLYILVIIFVLKWKYFPVILDVWSSIWDPFPFVLNWKTKNSSVPTLNIYHFVFQLHAHALYKNKQSGNKCPVSAWCHTRPEAFEIMAHYTRIHPKGLNASVTENKTQ